MEVTKYSANGNDFVMMTANKKSDRSALAQKLCHRQNGVGADGLVVVMPHDEYDFEWDFYNADGSSAAMCGNASRAVAHFAHEKGISINNKAEFLTGAGVIRATINGLYVVSDMVEPDIINKEIEEEGERWWLIDSGVPHLVCMVDDLEAFDLVEARRLREKYNANVNWYKIEGNTLFVRTYERGVEDETLACGTGTVASAVALGLLGYVKSPVEMKTKSGEVLRVYFNISGKKVTIPSY